MTDTKTLVKIAELGLIGDRANLLGYIQDVAVEAHNSNHKNLYRHLLTLVNKYSTADKDFSGRSSLVTNDIPLNYQTTKIWISKQIKQKIDNVIKLYKYSDSNLNFSSSFNKILLYGPPGTGKTTLGFYIAKELRQNIKYVKVSDVISSRFGETLKNIANVFENSSEQIIFIDEFDAFGKSRQDNNDIGELKRIVNSLIQTLDFYSSSKLVIVSTNLIESIDEALIRRFPIKIYIGTLSKLEQKQFIKFLIKSTQDINANLSNDDIKFLVDVLDEFELNTMYYLKTIFEQTVVLRLLNGYTKIKMFDFIETLFVEGYINKLNIKSTKIASDDLVKQIMNIIEQKYSKSKISQFVGMHRNTIKNYD